MKRILHLTHTDIRSDSRILKEISAAQENGYFVYGIGIELSEGASESETVDFSNILSIPLFTRKMTYLPKVVRHLLTFIELFCRVLYKSIRIKPDLIHCNDTLVLPIGMVVKFFTRSKLVYDAHELESNRNGLSNTLGRLTLLIEKMCWPFIDSLIVVSPSIEKWYAKELGVKRSEVILNSPLLEEKTSDISKDYLREYFQIPESNKIFLYIGILAPGRGIDLLINAFKKHEDTSSLVFLGYGELSGDLKSIASASPNVFVHDAVRHEKVVPIARSADVGLCLIQNVSLSDFYCLPNKLFEYCFAGIPVLASDFPDIQQVVESNNLGACVDLDVNSVSEGIEKIVSGQVGGDIDVSRLYDLSWQAQAGKLVNLYQDTLVNN